MIKSIIRVSLITVPKMENQTNLSPRQLEFNLQFSEQEIRVDEKDEEIVPLDRFFPSAEANELVAWENYNKHLYRPNTYLHKWWARRSGTTFRYILKQFVEQVDKRDYYEIRGLEGKTILDPMMGGGTIIHEAIRLGASVVGFDIDPIPVLQALASLTRIPIKEKRAVFASFYTALQERIAPLFVSTCPHCEQICESQFVLYGLRKQCACGESLFVDSYWLRENPDGTGIRLSPKTGHPFEVPGDFTESDEGRPSIFEKQVKRCPACGTTFQEVRSESFVNRYRPVVALVSCPKHGKSFKKADSRELVNIAKANELAAGNIQLPLDILRVKQGPKSRDLLKRGIETFAQLFTPRQHLYLAAARDFIDRVEEEHRLWLSILVSTSLEFNSLLCGYKGGDKRRPGAIRHVFSHHAYSFPYTALENNPVFSGNTSGTIRLLYQDRIEAGAEWAETPVERKPAGKGWTKIKLVGEKDWGVLVNRPEDLGKTSQSFWVRQQDSSHLPLHDRSIDHIVTDPPYYDSVQYSDLAQFFRVWLRWFLPEGIEWEYDLGDSAVAETNQDGGKYQQVLGAIWLECNRVLKRPEGRLVFTFHHWRPEAWAHLTLSLKKAGFQLVTSYTVLSENPVSVHIRQLKALKHDSILVLNPRDEENGKRWGLLERIDTQDSYQFCSQCAGLLGYCLQAELGDEEVFELWRNALGE
jgi:adenine-specific DNA methylase